MHSQKRRDLLKTLSISAIGAASFVGAAHARAPKVGGRFVDYEPYPSTAAPLRKVRVWLPPGYDAGERHAVLYMHDGQNLFDPADSVAWGAWEVDRHLIALQKAGKVRPTIVVGIWNTRENRGREYLPQAPVMTLPASLRDQVASASSNGETAPMSDAYLRFLVEDLKPFIDRTYRTRAGREDTFIMGSSMGGLVSLYALASYPQIFGGAGCLSTHWPMTTNGKLMVPTLDPRVEQIAQAYREWLAAKLPAAGAHKLYFDHGDMELDSVYPPFQAKVDELVRRKGYREGVDWITRAFPGTAHNEKVWRARLDIPLEFLLKPA